MPGLPGGEQLGKRLVCFPKRCFAVQLWFPLSPPCHCELGLFWKDRVTVEAL